MALTSVVIHQGRGMSSRLCVCVCVADVLCSLSDSQQYPAADTLSGRADWLTGACTCFSVCAFCVRVCMCVFVFSHVHEHKGACFASSKSMSPRGNVEPESKSGRDCKEKSEPWANRFCSPSPLHSQHVRSHIYLKSLLHNGGRNRWCWNTTQWNTVAGSHMFIKEDLVT